MIHSSMKIENLNTKAQITSNKCNVCMLFLLPLQIFTETENLRSLAKQLELWPPSYQDNHLINFHDH